MRNVISTRVIQFFQSVMKYYYYYRLSARAIVILSLRQNNILVQIFCHNTGPLCLKAIRLLYAYFVRFQKAKKKINVNIIKKKKKMAKIERM